MGLKAYEKADYNEAIGMFKDALTLPGTGIKQYRSAMHSGANPMFPWNVLCALRIAPAGTSQQ